MKRKCYIAAICIAVIMAVTACAGTGKETAGEEPAEMYREYLEAYMAEDWEAAAGFYDGYMTAAREALLKGEKKETRENILSAELSGVIEVPLDEKEYRWNFERLGQENEALFEDYEEIRGYLVGVDMSVSEATASCYNGINYEYCIMGKKDGEWKFLPEYQNGSGVIREYMMKAYLACGDEDIKRALNIAFINYSGSPVCVDGDGSVVKGTKEDIEKLNEWLEQRYSACGISDGIYVEEPEE